MSWGAAIGGLAGLASAGIGYLGQQQAARTAANAYRDASAQSDAATQQAIALSEPYRAAGLADYDAFRRNVGHSFQASPGYQFARGEGIRAIDQAASARGMLGSGGRLRELTRYGTGIADQEYNNWLSRLQSLASVGQAASGQAASLAQQGGQQRAALTVGGGQAAASGQVGQANALLGGLNQGLGIWALMRE